MSELPQDLHPWLIFDPDDAIEIHDYQLLATLLTQTFGIHKTICYPTLEDVNLLDSAVPLITKPWQRFFAIREATYYELTLEFLASFVFDRSVVNMEMQDCRTEPIFTESKSDFAEGEASAFWNRIGSRPFDPHTQKSTWIKHPPYRYLHRCIVLSIRVRKDSTGVVTVRDLFDLHCLIDQVSCNLAYSLAKFFNRATGYSSSIHIFGGPYIIHLAQYLGVLSLINPGQIQDMDLPVQPVDTQVIINMHMMKKFNRVYRLVGHRGNIWIGEVEESEDKEVPRRQLGYQGPDMYHTTVDPICWI
ncbi:hypothetical protein L1987_68794 [Smallanthus sonchifolius]|uniref:Uncharacterized protein n=1 Tax=Smallanthus sonchifolius TaxID=185202 RepID=A0ACB9B4X6_9ASTR|nr:hypothetical protein L1987_68794 [Smallanthus sonchifolius]